VNPLPINFCVIQTRRNRDIESGVQEVF
jgi:hypothetical protein